VRELSNIIHVCIGKDDRLVEYLPEDKHNVQNKRPDISKAKAQFGHNPRITLEEGIPRTIEWMRTAYGLSNASEIVGQGRIWGN
jgi:dTDP-glucose 4,6-dehydratase